MFKDIEYLLKRTSSGVIVPIRIVTRSSKNGILGVHNARIKFGVTAAPVDGKANQELINGLSKFFKVAKNSISIIKGEKSKDKQVLVVLDL